MRKEEYFNKNELKHTDILSNPPKKMYPQERDWTCSIACIRTILSGIEEKVPTEDSIVSACHMAPGPYYSKGIKELHILEGYDVKYGCDDSHADFDKVLQFMQSGYYVMLESMYNYSHWYVLLGYYPVADGDIEKSRLLVYDPYYNEVRLLNTDEFLGMWIDGNYSESRVKKDYIAVKAK